jgi:hypothetical protein
MHGGLIILDHVALQTGMYTLARNQACSQKFGHMQVLELTGKQPQQASTAAQGGVHTPARAAGQLQPLDADPPAYPKQVESDLASASAAQDCRCHQAGHEYKLNVTCCVGPSEAHCSCQSSQAGPILSCRPAAIRVIGMLQVSAREGLARVVRDMCLHAEELVPALAQKCQRGAPVRRVRAGAGTRPCGPRARRVSGTPVSSSARCCSRSRAAAAGPPPSRRTGCGTCACARGARSRPSAQPVLGTSRRQGASGCKRRREPGALYTPAAHRAQRGRLQAQVLQAGI